MRQWLHSCLAIRPVGRVLDIGCGGGEDLALMASAMPEVAEFVGLDSRPEVIESARRLHSDSRLSFIAASAEKALPFEHDSFDVVYSVNALECIADKDLFLKECHRVLKPGGQILIAHWDWDTQTFDGLDRDSVRRIVHAFNDWKQAWMGEVDPWMGRRLWKVVGGSGLFPGKMLTYTLHNSEFAEGSYGWQQVRNFAALAKRGMISDIEYESFANEQQSLAERGEYFFSVTLYAYLGVK